MDSFKILKFANKSEAFKRIKLKIAKIIRNIAVEKLRVLIKHGYCPK